MGTATLCLPATTRLLVLPPTHLSYSSKINLMLGKTKTKEKKQNNERTDVVLAACMTNMYAKTLSSVLFSRVLVGRRKVVEGEGVCVCVAGGGICGGWICQQ